MLLDLALHFTLPGSREFFAVPLQDHAGGLEREPRHLAGPLHERIARFVKIEARPASPTSFRTSSIFSKNCRHRSASE